MPLYGRFRGFFIFCVCVRLAAPPPLCGLVGVKKRRPPPTHPHLKIVDNSRFRPALKVAVSRVFQGFSRRLPPHPALSRISQISCLPTEKKKFRYLFWGFAAVCAVISLLCVDSACNGPLFGAFEKFASALGADYSGIVVEGSYSTRVNGIYNDANITAGLLSLSCLVGLHLVRD